MRNHEVDVAIIGAGTAGLNARKEVERLGASWVLIEGGPYGTTCARVGCMPSKLLIAAADAAHEVSRAARFGVEVQPAGWTVNGRAVMERVRAERDRFAGAVAEATDDLPAEHRLRGWARFVGPTALRVGDDTEVRARAVVVATGSSPWMPPQLEPVRDRVLTSDDIFEIEQLPHSIAVFGTGIIGLELGQALGRLGVRTHLFNPFDELGPFSDPRVGRVARDELGQELGLHLGAQEVGLDEVDGEVRVRWREPEGAQREERFEAVLAAAGRRPNLKSLALAETGLTLDKRGRPPWNPQTCQAGDLPIFFAGDVSGHRPLLHEAADEGRIAGANAVRWPDVIAAVRRTGLAVAFTDPQMAVVGERFADLDPEQIEIGEVDFASQGRARVMMQNRGLVRIYADRRNCVLLGAEMFGPRVEHTAHLLAWAVQQGLRAQQVLAMPFYHPVVEEGIRAALRDLASKLRVTGGCPPEDRAESPGA